MPGREEKTARSAGISSADASAVFERLKEEVRGRPSAPSDGRRGSGRMSARGEAERLWSVAVDRPIERRPGLRGALVYPVKRLLRKLMSWYVGPFAAEQRSFNAAVLRLADELSVLNDELRARLEQEAGERASSEAEIESRLEGRIESAAAESAGRDAELGRRLAGTSRMLDELEERLLRLERRPRTAQQGTGTAPLPPPEPDYFAFEARMRGLTADVRGRQDFYVDDFRGCAPVLDIGCGRGEFLQLMREAGIEARGIDIDPDMVAFCRGEGLDVEQHDAIAYLEGLADGALGGIFCAHVLEHFPPQALLRLLGLAKAKLRPEGLFAAETPNPRTLVALSTFVADLTHAQPLHPETLSYLTRQAGFRQVEVRYLNPPPDEGRLRAIPLADEEACEALNANVERLNEVIFGPQDYAVLARA